MELRKLTIGDKVYRKYFPRFSQNTVIDLAEVIRLTPTQAVLSNGVRLINEIPKTNPHNKLPSYRVKGESFQNYFITTDEIINEAEELKRINKIKTWWFNSKDKFTIQQVEQIYKILNN